MPRCDSSRRLAVLHVRFRDDRPALNGSLGLYRGLSESPRVSPPSAKSTMGRDDRRSRQSEQEIGPMNEQNGLAELRAIAHKAMTDRGLEPDFPPDAIRQLDGIQGPANDRDRGIRDLRDRLWCSIDNDTSRDLDQRTVAERLTAGRVRVLVAIADVDALVKSASPIDRHAGTNTTSVYTAARIFPMLPERLSTDLTSLNENADRLALVVEMVVAPDGLVETSEVYRALVHNHAKLAYRSVAAWLDGSGAVPDRSAKTAGLDEQLRMQDQLAHVMRSVRYVHGALDLETIEPEAVLRDGQVVDLRLDGRNRAKGLIEDFMIAANGVAAAFLEKRGSPALRRVVRSPERWDRIRKVAEGSGDRLPPDPIPRLWRSSSRDAYRRTRSGSRTCR